ncbi:MAG: hypothetical protein AAFX94_00680, partial [Myxococcota bacterium]
LQPLPAQPRCFEPRSAAATTFAPKDGAPEWLGLLIADHVTRRLLVQPAEGQTQPPLYVFGSGVGVSAVFGASSSALDLDGSFVGVHAARIRADSAATRPTRAVENTFM